MYRIVFTLSCLSIGLSSKVVECTEVFYCLETPQDLIVLNAESVECRSHEVQRWFFGKAFLASTELLPRTRYLHPNYPVVSFIDNKRIFVGFEIKNAEGSFIFSNFLKKDVSDNTDTIIATTMNYQNNIFVLWQVAVLA